MDYNRVYTLMMVFIVIIGITMMTIECAVIRPTLFTTMQMQSTMPQHDVFKLQRTRREHKQQQLTVIQFFELLLGTIDAMQFGNHKSYGMHKKR